MNRTDTEAAISGHLPRRARRHLPAIMAAVDAHAAAGREDLDRVVAEGARRQRLVAEEFRRVKAEADEARKQRGEALAKLAYSEAELDAQIQAAIKTERLRGESAAAEEFQAVKAERDEARAEAAELGKQVRVLVEERAAALAEANRLRESARLKAIDVDALTAARDDYAARLKATDKSWSELAAERDRTRERLTAERDRALSLLTIRTQERDAETAANKDLAAERDRLREQLAAHEASQKAEAEMAVPSPGEIVAGLAGPNTLTVGPGAPAPAAGGDAEPAQNRARTATGARTARGTGTRKARGGTGAPRDADGGTE